MDWKRETLMLKQRDILTIYCPDNGTHKDFTFSMDETNNTLAAGYLWGF